MSKGRLNRPTGNKKKDKRERSSERICAWAVVKPHDYFEEMGFDQWCERKTISEKPKQGVKKKAKDAEVYPWEAFTCSLTIDCPSLDDVTSFVANCYDKKPRPATTKSVKPKQPAVDAVEDGSESSPSVSGVEDAPQADSPDDIGDAEASEVNDCIGASLTPKLIEISPEGLQKRTKYNLCRPRSKSAIEIPRFRSKLRRERRRISLREDNEANSPIFQRLVVSRNSMTNGDLGTPDPLDYLVRPLVKSASQCDVAALDESARKSGKVCSKADEEFRDLANKIIFGDKDPHDSDANKTGSKVVSAARPTVRLQYSNSNISLRPELTSGTAGKETGNTTKDISNPQFVSPEECFVTNINSFDKAPESAEGRGPTISSARNGASQEQVIGANVRCWTPKAAIPKTFFPDDNSTTIMPLASNMPAFRAPLPRVDSFHKINSDIQSHMNSGEGVNGICTVSMDPSILKLAGCLKVGETSGGSVNPYLSSILRAKSPTTTFFPIADLLPAVERSLHTGFNQNRAPPPPPEKFVDHDLGLAEKDLLLAGKDRLLNYEESLLLMREGVDLLRLKERNQAFLGPPAFRPQQNRTPLHRARESTAKRMHGNLSLAQDVEDTKNRWPSASGHLYKPGSGSLSAREHSDSPERKRDQTNNRSVGASGHRRSTSSAKTARSASGSRVRQRFPLRTTSGSTRGNPCRTKSVVEVIEEDDFEDWDSRSPTPEGTRGRAAVCMVPGYPRRTVTVSIPLRRTLPNVWHQDACLVNRLQQFSRRRKPHDRMSTSCNARLGAVIERKRSNLNPNSCSGALDLATN